MLMAVVLGLEVLAQRVRMPPAAAFILGGITLALIPNTPDIELDPDLVLVLFLPPLLLASAYRLSTRRDCRKGGAPAPLLAPAYHCAAGG